MFKALSLGQKGYVLNMKIASARNRIHPFLKRLARPIYLENHGKGFSPNRLPCHETLPAMVFLMSERVSPFRNDHSGAANSSG